MRKAEKEIYLKNRLEELKKIEEELRSRGFSYIAGVDEVGRGPLAGPVVAACVVLPSGFDVLGVDDSKKITEKKRKELYGVILDQALCFGIGERDSNIIDEINILEATRLAMADAVKKADAMLMGKTGQRIDYVLFDAMRIDRVNKPQSSVVRGDSRCISISASSIVAKVYRDRLMVSYDSVYPGYGFKSNKGYGTKAHYEGLRDHGLTPIHRRTFLKNFISQNK